LIPPSNENAAVEQLEVDSLQDPGVIAAAEDAWLADP